MASPCAAGGSRRTTLGSGVIHHHQLALLGSIASRPRSQRPAELTSRLNEAGLTWTCACNPCEVKKLDLKFAVHHGSYIVQAIRTHVEVLGPDITVAHRLLENTAVSKVGTPAYALFTSEAESAPRLCREDGFRFTEPVDGADPVKAVAIPLGV